MDWGLTFWAAATYISHMHAAWAHKYVNHAPSWVHSLHPRTCPGPVDFHKICVFGTSGYSAQSSSRGVCSCGSIGENMGKWRSSYRRILTIKLGKMMNSLVSNLGKWLFSHMVKMIRSEILGCLICGQTQIWNEYGEGGEPESSISPAHQWSKWARIVRPVGEWGCPEWGNIYIYISWYIMSWYIPCCCNVFSTKEMMIRYDKTVPLLTNLKSWKGSTKRMTLRFSSRKTAASVSNNSINWLLASTHWKINIGHWRSSSHIWFETTNETNEYIIGIGKCPDQGTQLGFHQQDPWLSFNRTGVVIGFSLDLIGASYTF